MPAVTLNTIYKELQSIKRMMQLQHQSEKVWLTARETGKTPDQLRYFRETQPHRVRIAKEGKRSFLYNIQ